MLGGSGARDERGLRLWYRRLGLMVGGGIETLARPTSPVVASVSAYWALRVEGVLERSWIEDCEREESPEVVRERGSKGAAIGCSDERHELRSGY